MLTKLVVQPSQLGILKGRFSGSILRPRRQLMAGGMAYVTPSATTDADTMALYALVDPRKTKPKITTKIDVKINAFNGTTSLWWILANHGEAGRPPSRANAYTIRLLVVKMEIPAN